MACMLLDLIWLKRVLIRLEKVRRRCNWDPLCLMLSNDSFTTVLFLFSSATPRCIRVFLRRSCTKPSLTASSGFCITFTGASTIEDKRWNCEKRLWLPFLDGLRRMDWSVSVMNEVLGRLLPGGSTVPWRRRRDFMPVLFDRCKGFPWWKTPALSSGYTTIKQQPITLHN